MFIQLISNYFTIGHYIHYPCNNNTNKQKYQKISRNNEFRKMSSYCACIDRNKYIPSKCKRTGVLVLVVFVIYIDLSVSLEQGPFDYKYIYIYTGGGFLNIYFNQMFYPRLRDVGPHGARGPRRVPRSPCPRSGPGRTYPRTRATLFGVRKIRRREPCWASD